MVNSFEPTSSLPRMLSELLLLLSTKSKHRSLCCGQHLSINHPVLPAVPCSFHAFFLTLVRIAAKSFPCPCLFMLISLSPHFSSLSPHSLSLLPTFSPPLSLLPPFPPPSFPSSLLSLLPPFPSLLSLSPSLSLLSSPFLSLFLPLSSLFLFSYSSFPFPFLFLSLLFVARPCSALLFRFSCSSFFLLSFIRFLCFFFVFFFNFSSFSIFPISSFSFFLFRFFCFPLFFFLLLLPVFSLFLPF